MRSLFLTFLIALVVSLPAAARAQTSRHAEAASGNAPSPAATSEAELYHTLAEKKAAGLETPLSERLTLSGLLEIEGTSERIEGRDGSAFSASDLAVATVQLGFGLDLTESVHANLAFLYEEDSTELEVDEAAIDVAWAPLFLRAGRIYLPFGVYTSHFISDPLILELGETRETALLLGFGHQAFSVSAFAFNGDADRTGSEAHLEDWGASLAVTPLAGLEFGGSVLSDLGDSDAELAPAYRERVGGWSAYAVGEFHSLALSGEVLGARERFASEDLDADGDGRGDRPLAWNLELAWYLSKTWELAARYEGSSEFGGQPESQYGLSASWGVRENVTLSLEYLRGHYDAEFGRDDDDRILDRRDLVTAQLSLAF